MPLRLNGSTSGYSQLDAPAIAGDQTFTLPGTGGTLDRLNRAGNVIQVVTTAASYATGTTLIPFDNTIPQNTEGTEFMTLAITPTSASNKLLICVNAFMFSGSLQKWVTGALFQDSTANSLAAAAGYIDAAGAALTISFDHYMTAGTTSSTTFKFRAGPDAAATVAINGSAVSQLFGGVATSRMTIWEIAA